MSKKLISLVIPVYNESENIFPFYEAVLKEINVLDTKYDFEFIFTNNKSTDNTLDLLKELSNRDSRIRIYSFSRNFGYQRSIFTGYSKARGDALIQLDCDLQDPPSLIKDFLSEWEDGSKVVYGIRLTRKENIVISNVRKVFYRLIDAICEYPLPHDAGDFRLVDRVVIDELVKTNNFAPYLRGEISYIGFKQKGIYYHRQNRQRGKSKFNVSALFRLAFDGIVSHSIVPLRVATYIGLLTAVFSLLLCSIYLISHFVWGAKWPPGFATTTLLILFSVSLNACFLGIIGEYIGRIYNQVISRSFIIIEDELSNEIK